MDGFVTSVGRITEILIGRNFKMENNKTKPGRFFLRLFLALVIVAGITTLWTWADVAMYGESQKKFSRRCYDYLACA